jgi:hypothetical protein
LRRHSSVGGWRSQVCMVCCVSVLNCALCPHGGTRTVLITCSRSPAVPYFHALHSSHLAPQLVALLPNMAPSPLASSPATPLLFVSCSQAICCTSFGVLAPQYGPTPATLSLCQKHTFANPGHKSTPCSSPLCSQSHLLLPAAEFPSLQSSRLSHRSWCPCYQIWHGYCSGGGTTQQPSRSWRPTCCCR